MLLVHEVVISLDMVLKNIYLEKHHLLVGSALSIILSSEI